MTDRSVLVIDPPAVLKFKGSFSSIQTVELKLHNPTNELTLFKIKTTAPKRYCVRPNSGSVEPFSNVTVSITYQPGQNETEERSKHKFLVQSIRAPDSATKDYDAMWKTSKADQIAETRLKCLFDGGETTNGNGASTLQERNINSVGSMPADLINNLNLTHNGSSAGSEHTANTTVASSADAASPDRENLTSVNRQLRARISQLTDECARLRESELRLRRMTTPDESTGNKSARQSENLASVEVAPSLNTKLLAALAFVALLVGLVFGKVVL